MPQLSRSDFVNDLDKAGLLGRIREEKRVDELSLLANAYSNVQGNFEPKHPKA
jgi:hypothetical protein